MSEKEVLSYLKENIDNPVLHAQLGIIKSRNSEVSYNTEINNKEYDMIIYNSRTILGTPILFFNVEYEARRSNNSLFSLKHNDNFLLSFIFNNSNNKYTSAINSDKIYSTSVYTHNGLEKGLINFHNKFMLKMLKTDNNIAQLESILYSKQMNLSTKNAVLFFLNDIITGKYEITNFELRHIFYEPKISCVRAIFGDNGTKKGVDFFIDSKKTRFLIENNNSMKEVVQKYLKYNYAKGVPHFSNKDEIVLLTTKKDCPVYNKTISRIMTIRGEKEEIFPGTSIKKIIKI
ncbi:Uncharacterised protein [Candidatus Tiddalikarchaeum anstoanum]|nr:Uncharacterised protein [Candidatus Tiddalikarchaeum anstoanum]